MKSKLWGVAAALAGLLAAGAAQAGGHVSWSVTVGSGGYYPGPMYSPAPQVVGSPMYMPAPVYYQPAPVYVQPPVVYAPRYVVPAPVYYQPAPVYVEGGWRGGHGRGHGRGHGHHRRGGWD
jgi:hypothetical protein